MRIKWTKEKKKRWLIWIGALLWSISLFGLKGIIKILTVVLRIGRRYIIKSILFSCARQASKRDFDEED